MSVISAQEHRLAITVVPFSALAYLMNPLTSAVVLLLNAQLMNWATTATC